MKHIQRTPQSAPSVPEDLENRLGDFRPEKSHNFRLFAVGIRRLSENGARYTAGGMLSFTSKIYISVKSIPFNNVDLRTANFRDPFN